MIYNAKSTTTTTFNLVVLAFAIMLVGGLIAIPIIEEAQAADDRNKGKQGDAKSDGKRQGRGSDV
jgi:hypothetical protein